MKVAARVEILPSGQVKISALEITYITGSREQIDELRARLSAGLVNGWSEVSPRTFDFTARPSASQAASRPRWCGTKPAMR